MIRRPPRSTQSRSSAASDVYKRQEERRTDRERGDDEGDGGEPEERKSVHRTGARGGRRQEKQRAGRRGARRETALPDRFNRARAHGGGGFDPRRLGGGQE